MDGTVCLSWWNNENPDVYSDTRAMDLRYFGTRKMEVEGKLGNEMSKLVTAGSLLFDRHDE